MSARAYIFVPNDGSFAKPLAPAEVKSMKHIEDPDHALQTRFSELLHQKNVNVAFWLCDKGVMILGSQDQARVISNIVTDTHGLIVANGNRIAANNDNTIHIASVFSKAAEPKIVRPSADFNMAASDEQKTISIASRPSIRGNVMRTLEAA